MNLDVLLSKEFPPLEQELTQHSAILYALGVGFGDQPTDPRELQFLYEKHQPKLEVMPSIVNVLCHPGGWILDPRLEINWVKLLHGEQSFEIMKPIQVGKTYVGTFRILDVIDKGADKGCMIFMEKALREKGSDEISATVTSTYFLRGDGGCGGTTDKAPVPHAIPDRPADGELTLTTLERSALIYRLSGDYNPIHADPEMARKAGFEKPILHGLCTLGVVTRAVLRQSCDDRPERLRSLALRYSAPVLPGETVVTEFWQDGPVVSFRSKVQERGIVVLNNGRAVVAS